MEKRKRRKNIGNHTAKLKIEPSIIYSIIFTNLYNERIDSRNNKYAKYQNRLITFSILV